ncbi:MAG: hypothetical protein ACRDRU_04725 [Pseudonocardiaceae bacterium]
MPIQLGQKPDGIANHEICLVGLAGAHDIERGFVLGNVANKVSGAVKAQEQTGAQVQLAC